MFHPLKDSQSKFINSIYWPKHNKPLGFNKALSQILKHTDQRAPRPFSTADVTFLHEFVFWLSGLMYFSLAFSTYHKHQRCLPKEFTRISKHIQLKEACFGSSHTGCVTFFGHHSCLMSSSLVCLIDLRALSHLTW